MTASMLHQIDALIKQWRGPPPSDPMHNRHDADQWRPLPNYPDLRPRSPSAPLSEIADARKIKSGASTPMTPKCLGVLRNILNGSVPLGPTCHHRPNQDPFHCYRIKKLGMPMWRDWASHTSYAGGFHSTWYCKDFQNAAAHYAYTEFPHGTFADLAASLQYALRVRDQALAAAMCTLILKWGGVYHYEWCAKTRTQLAVDANSNTLVDNLLGATALLLPYCNAPLISFGSEYLLDSGMTKIYAAAALDLSDVSTPSQDVLIYDGRVGSALGLLTRYTLTALGVTRVPAEFEFPRDQRRARMYALPHLASY